MIQESAKEFVEPQEILDLPIETALGATDIAGLLATKQVFVGAETSDTTGQPTEIEGQPDSTPIIHSAGTNGHVRKHSLKRNKPTSKSKRRPKTTDPEDLMHSYLENIGEYELLTKEDEIRLAKAIETGRTARQRLTADQDCSLSPLELSNLRKQAEEGEQAHDEFVHANLRLVVSTARRYKNSGLPLLDLIQEGNLGLIHAVDKFDWRKGFKFSTYATWWIAQAMQRGIANTSRTIRLPVHAGDDLRLLMAVRSQLESEGQVPTNAELAAELGMTESRVNDILVYAQQTPVSLSESLTKYSADTELGDVIEDHAAISPQEAAIESTLPSLMDKILAVLDKRERTIISMRFGLYEYEPMNCDQVGQELGITRQAVNKMEAKILDKLRHPSNDTGAREFLDI